jgi:IS30 family transposase
MAEERRAMNARMIDALTSQFAQEMLMLQWSPEQISGHAAFNPETVYQRICADKQ